MKGWRRRVRGALGMGVIWAGGGAFIGGLVELASNIFPGLPLGFIDMWIQTLAIPGFLGGVTFSIVLGSVTSRGRLDELSVPAVAASGAVGGVLLGAGLIVVGFPLLILAPAVVLSAVGATLSLVLARSAEERDLLAAASETQDVGLTPQEERELLG